MWCCGTVRVVKFKPNNAIPGQGAMVMNLARDLKLSKKTVDYLYTAYLKLDPDDRGQIDLKMMIAQWGLEQSPLLLSLFELFDSNSVDFKTGFENWMLACWNILTMTEEKQIVEYMIGMVHLGTEQFITKEELNYIFMCIWGEGAWQTSPIAQKSVDSTKFDSKNMSKGSKDKSTTLKDIYDMIELHPIVFMPIYNALQVMKSSICGEYFWEQQAFDRKNDFKCLDILDILSERFDKTVSSINFLTSLHAQISPPTPYSTRLAEIKAQNRTRRVVTKSSSDTYVEQSRGVGYELKKRLSISLTPGASDALKSKVKKMKHSQKQEGQSPQQSQGSSGGVRGMVRRLSNAASNALKFKSTRDGMNNKQSKYKSATEVSEKDDDDDEEDIEVEDELYGGDPDNQDDNSGQKQSKNAFYRKEKKIKDGKSGEKSGEKSDKNNNKDKDAAAPKKEGIVRRLTNMLIKPKAPRGNKVVPGNRES